MKQKIFFSWNAFLHCTVSQYSFAFQIQILGANMYVSVLTAVSKPVNNSGHCTSIYVHVQSEVFWETFELDCTNNNLMVAYKCLVYGICNGRTNSP